MVQHGKIGGLASRLLRWPRFWGALAALATASLLVAAGCETPELAASATGSSSPPAIAADGTSAGSPALMDESQGYEAMVPMDSPSADESPEWPPAEPVAELPSAALVEPEAPAAAAPADEFAAARELFSARCQRCHSIGGDALAGGPEGPPPGDGGGPGRGMRGPDLSHIGASSDKTVEWIADHIRDPKSHNQRSRMPAFAEQLSDEEIIALAELLASLR